MKNSHELSFRESVDRMFDRATATMDLPLGLADQIRCCNSVYQVQFGVKLDDRYEVFTGWRAVHSEHILPVMVASVTPTSPIKTRSRRWRR